MTIRKFLRSVKVLLSRWKHGVRDVHRTSYLAWGSSIAKDLKMGPFGFIASGASIPPHVEMGKYVIIGPDLLVTGNDHRFDQPGNATIFSGRPDPKPCIIEDDVWIGARVTILTGNRIGRGSIIATGSIVTHDVPPYSIMAGVPAKPIKQRFEGEAARLHDAYLERPACEGEYCEAL